MANGEFTNLYTVSSLVQNDLVCGAGGGVQHPPQRAQVPGDSVRLR